MLFFKFRYVLVTVFRCGNSDVFICYIEYSSKSMRVHSLIVKSEENTSFSQGYSILAIIVYLRCLLKKKSEKSKIFDNLVFFSVFLNKI